MRQSTFLFAKILPLLFLVQLACHAGPYIQVLDRIDCESRGGTWRMDVSPYRCDLPAKPTIQTGEAVLVEPAPTLRIITPITPRKTTLIPAGDCLADIDSYNWIYENIRKSSGTGGVACNARFIVKNTGLEPFHLIVHTTWDNLAMESNQWANYSFQPGSAWEQDVHRANYSNGDTTFDIVDRIWVILDTPGCAAYLSDEMQYIWESQALYIEKFDCP